MENMKEKDTILLIDDEDVVLNIGEKMLKKLGYDVLLSSNGLEAARIYGDKKETIGLVILDVLMPKVSGSETCRGLKDINPKVKIVHTSGMDSHLITREMNCGCISILQKPFRLENLSNKISEMLNNS